MVRAAESAFGRSGGVRLRFSLPGDRVDVPLEMHDAPEALEYEWVPIGSLTPVDSARSLISPMRAPQRPGFYRLAVVGPGGRRVVEGVTLAVMVPFGLKRGSSLNGYRIGYYRGERVGKAANSPAGFLEISADFADLQISEHLNVSDFLTRDGQTTWPRYAAVDPRLLDKLELVFAELASSPDAIAGSPVDFEVHSGFRTPRHNRAVTRSAGDSRHQYGDAADIAIDANRDGRIDARDVRLIALAVEAVERAHPDLVGGLGQYTRNGSPYAHIDTRGTRVRWRG